MPIRTTNLEKNIKSISKDTLVYGISGASINIVTLVSFPLLARNFTVIDFGQLDLFFSTFAFAIALMISGQDSAIFRFFNDEVNSQKQSELITSSLGFQLFCSVMVIFIFFLHAISWR